MGTGFPQHSVFLCSPTPTQQQELDVVCKLQIKTLQRSFAPPFLFNGKNENACSVARQALFASQSTLLFSCRDSPFDALCSHSGRALWPIFTSSSSPQAAMR